MKRFLKWTAIGLGSLVASALLVIYGVSEYRLRQRFDVAAAPQLAIPDDSASIARGQHIAETRGCAGCHGANLEGKVFFDQPMLARLIAPNLTKVVREYSVADLARVIRHGVRPNGTSVAVMPSAMLYHLSDRDLGALIAYLRSVPFRESALPRNSMRLLARVGLVTSQYQTEAARIDHDAPRVPEPIEGDVAAGGRYLAMTTCSECHGLDLKGQTDTPALTVVQAYTAEQFARLMREGVPPDGRKLGLMGDVARSRFSRLTDAEVAALYAYLQDRAAAVRSGASARELASGR